MTPEAKDRLLANAITLRGDIEALIERIDAHALKRQISPFWAKWITRTLMTDRDAINNAIDIILFTEMRVYPTERQALWGRLTVAYDAASFALSYAHQLLAEELGEF
jgi:hypothetical protein